ALRAELLRRGEGRGGGWGGGGGPGVSNVALLAIFLLLIPFYRRPVYADLGRLASRAVVFGIAVFGAWVTWRFVSDAPELIPIPFAAMLITVLISGRVAMVAALVLAVLLGTQAAYGGENALYIASLGSVAGTLGVRTVRRRSQLLAASGIVTAGFALAAVTVGLRYGWSLTEMGASVLRGAVNGLVAA